MKKLLFLFFIIHLNCFSILNFVSNKTKNGSLDSNFLKEMKSVFKCDAFLETGTYDGKTAQTAALIFNEVHTVELEYHLFQNTNVFLSTLANVKTYHDSSPEMIKSVAPSIKGRILFWLDAHYSGEGTAMSNNNPYSPDAITPICDELKAIKECGLTDCVILIDDIRGFGSTINGIEYLGCWAYPSIQEVCDLGKQINHNFSFALLGDTLLMYDTTQHTPPLSPVVEACTRSRLYDGINLTDQELIDYEKTIMNTQGEEKKFITELYNRMTDCKDPLFHHDLWYGLISIGSEDWQKALIAMSKVPFRIEHLNKSCEQISKPLHYNHWRIQEYIALIEKYLTSLNQ